jgi:hypothetical protein
LVPPLLERLERQRYDGDSLFRFNISDLFSLGPVVAYLREHPRGPRPRVMFLGSSVVWGWEVRAPETMPAQFQRLNPGLRVLNFGLNASETPTSYLIARDVVDAVDLFVAIDFGDGANPRLSTMIPVEPRDIERFNLRRPDRVEAMLERAFARWRLYDDAYRLQSALFGTSTRLFVYMHKTDFLRGRFGPPAADSVPASIAGYREAAGSIQVSHPRAEVEPSGERVRQLQDRFGVLWEFASMITAHHRRAVFIELAGHSNPIADDDRADLNAVFGPAVAFVKLTVPKALTSDGLHFTPLGSAAIAHVVTDIAPSAARLPQSSNPAGSAH